MSVTAIIKSPFHSNKPDGPDPTQYQPSYQNAPRIVEDGLENNGDFLVRDRTSPTGMSWLPLVAAFPLVLTGNNQAANSIDGLVLENPTLSTLAVPVQKSPRMRLRAHVWNTAGVDNTNDWIIESVPISAATPTGQLSFKSSLNGAAYIERLLLDSFGSSVFGNSMTIGAGDLTISGSGNMFRVGSRVRLRWPADGQMTLANNGETVVRTLSGVLHVSTASVGTDADLAVKDLWTYTLPANALNVDGRAIRITVWYTTAANANAGKTGILRFGGSQVAARASVGDNNWVWKFSVVVFRTGASAQFVTSDTFVGAFGSTSANGQMNTFTTAIDTTAAIIIKATGQNGVASAGDVTFKAAVVEFLN